MTQEEREAFMKGLEVDAVALAKVIWQTGNTREAGWQGLLPGGKRIRPAAMVAFSLWRRGRTEPAWEERGIRGCPSIEGIEDLGGIQLFSDMGPILTEATENGYVALLDRYEQALASEDGSVGVSMQSLTETAKCR